MNACETPCQTRMRLPWLVKVNSLVLGCFALLLCVVLCPAWLHNPDLSHGLFMPFFFLLLIYQSRSDGPRRFLLGGRSATWAAVLAALAGLAVLFIAGLYAAVLDWSNAAVSYALAGALVLFLGAALIGFADNRIRLVPFNWTACVAAALWPLCAPIPPGTYTRLTIGLQIRISVAVVHALHLLGIPAYRTGNIIELATTTVGVEEACSGVRSLVSCVFIGLFLSASLVRRTWVRVFIVALSPVLAIGMNFVRSLILTLLANDGVDIHGAWHDVTGYAILVVTAAILGGLAFWLGRAPPGKEPPAIPFAKPSSGVPSSQGILAAVLALAGVLIVFFYANTHPSVRSNAPVPDLWAVLPDTAEGWTVTTTRNLYQFKDTLQTDVLAQRIYTSTGAERPTTLIFYLAYWRPGQAPVSLVASHTPDACWPGSGWAPQPLPQSREPLTIAGQSLPPAESRLFTNRDYLQYVWFWHLYDGRMIAYQNPYSLRELLKIAWHYGFRHNGDQLFVRASSNRPWSEIAGEPVVQQFFTRLKSLGL